MIIREKNSRPHNGPSQETPFRSSSLDNRIEQSTGNHHTRSKQLPMVGPYRKQRESTLQCFKKSTCCTSLIDATDTGCSIPPAGPGAHLRPVLHHQARETRV